MQDKLKHLVPVFLIALLLSPCSLDHYSPDKTIKIIPRFPSEASDNALLAKPADAPANYTPDFVDWIDVTVTDQNGSSSIYRATRSSEGTLIAEVDLADMSYDSVLDIEVSVYSGSHNGSCSPDNTAACLLTHEGSVQGVEISSTSENASINIDLNYLSADLDGDDPMKVQLASDSGYCITLDDEGNLLLVLTNVTDGEKFKVSIYDSHGKHVSDSLPDRPLLNTIKNPVNLNCVYSSGALIIPYFGSNLNAGPPYYANTPSILQFEGTKTRQRAVAPSFNYDGDLHFSIDAGQGYIAAAYRNASGQVYFKSFSETLYDLDADDPGVLLCSGCSDPRVMIVDENRYIVSVSVSSEIQGRMISRDNESAANPLLKLSGTGFIPLGEHMLTKLNDDRFAVFYCGRKEVESDNDCFYNLLESDLNLSGFGTWRINFSASSETTDQDGLFIASGKISPYAAVYLDRSTIVKPYLAVISEKPDPTVDSNSKIFDPEDDASNPTVVINDDGLTFIAFLAYDSGLSSNAVQIKRYLISKASEVTPPPE